MLKVNALSYVKDHSSVELMLYMEGVLINSSDDYKHLSKIKSLKIYCKGNLCDYENLR